MQENEVQHVFLVGAKSLGTYGGYETFVNKLTEYHQNNSKIKYHVACKANGDGSMDPGKIVDAQIVNEHEFIYHNAQCFRIRIPEKLGSAQAIYYDIAALKKCCKIIKQNQIIHPIIYIMACRIGPFIKYFYHKIHKLGGKIYLNPDGHEWKRAKWNRLIRAYWKLSEKFMVNMSDLVICDSINIEKYIKKNYDTSSKKINTTFIAYGAETRDSYGAEERYEAWLKKNGLRSKEYYLVVGRFVPENNFEIMIREFMKSNSKKDFAIITNVNEKFLSELERKLHFQKDKRIKFVGTVYDAELLMKIREEAYGYFHGHEVGGTNPSLLEALGSTDLNLLLNVGFNKEVAEDAAFYWDKKPGNLAKLIDKVDIFSEEMRKEMGEKAKERIQKAYSWNFICERYLEEFLK